MVPRLSPVVRYLSPIAASELVATPDARVGARDPVVDVRSGVVGSKNETTGESTGLLRIGYARVEIDVPCKPPVDAQREHIQRSAATRRGGTEGGAGRRLSGVSCGSARNVGERARRGAGTDGVELLTDAVVGGSDIKCRCYRIFHAGPEHMLVPVGEIVVVIDEGEVIATFGKGAGLQRVVRIGELDLLLSSVQLALPDRVFAGNLEHDVVRNDGRRTAERTGDGVSRSRHRCAACHAAYGCESRLVRSKCVDLRCG